MAASLFYAVLMSSLTSLLNFRHVSVKHFRRDVEQCKKYVQTLQGEVAVTTCRHNSNEETQLIPSTLDSLRGLQDFTFTRARFARDEHQFMQVRTILLP